MPAFPSIFISYRIADSLTQAGRLHQSLEAELGKGTVFYDKSNLKPGMKWDDELAGKVRRAQVVLVLIANRSKWLGVGDEGRRIDDPDDWVRQEVEAALDDSQKLVIPVLINDAQLPTEKAFSTDETKGLLPLLKRQHKQIREANWDDGYEDIGKPQTNPSGPRKGTRRVLRGGSWGRDALLCRVSYRVNFGTPGDRGNDLGFRLASSPQ